LIAHERYPAVLKGIFIEFISDQPARHIMPTCSSVGLASTQLGLAIFPLFDTESLPHCEHQA
jgi:hypothetical protein